MQTTAQPISVNQDATSGEPAAAACSEIVHIKPVHSMEEMMQAFAVRSAVFLGEQACSYAEEFDGNDFTATHLLGLVGNEPASACRLRYFADFVRLERFAVRREFRTGDAGTKLIRFALEFARKKGFLKVHGEASGPVVRYQRRFGFKRIKDESFVVGGHEYVELMSTLEPHPDPIAIGEDPLVLLRREGAWDEPTKFEPHVTGAEPAPMTEAQQSVEWTAELRKQMARLG